MMKTGTIVDLLLAIALTAFTFYFIQRARQGDPIRIQRLPGVDAIEEGIGRAVEMGRPVHYATGMGAISSTRDVSAKVLSLYILGSVAEMCSQQRADLYVSERDPLTVGYIREILRTAYEKTGWPEGYREENIMWFPWTSIAYALPNWFQEVKPGANFMMGSLFFGTIIIAEAGALQGAFQIGYGQTQFLMATCEYVLIADEFYATSAYMSKDPTLVGGIAGIDYVKMALLGLLLVSFILLNIGTDIMTWLKA
jgi:hypothetical protein